MIVLNESLTNFVRDCNSRTHLDISLKFIGLLLICNTGMFSLLTYIVMNSNSQKLACANKESVGTDLSKMVLNMYNVREDVTLHRQNCYT